MIGTDTWARFRRAARRWPRSCKDYGYNTAVFGKLDQHTRLAKMIVVLFVS